jgi:hypothetical protein
MKSGLPVYLGALGFSFPKKGQLKACDRRLSLQNTNGSGTSRALRDLLPYKYVT